MFKIILTVITLALIATSCDHNQRMRTNYHFDYGNTPDHNLEADNGLIITDDPVAREIPEPSFLLSYALISVSCAMIKKK